MEWKQEEILIIVKVYPSPSKTYGEIVCTAGITIDGKWIRLYPVPFRDLPRNQQFHKFQWISARVSKAKEKLNRPESYKIDSASIKLLTRISDGSGWKEREKYFMPLVRPSLEDIIDQQKENNISLGIFKPKKVEDFIIEKDNENWVPKKQGILGQNTLFNTNRSTLEKIPYTFHYKFTCDDKRCPGHNLIVLDWEAAESYRNFKRTYKDEDLTLKKLKEKWLDFYFVKRESYFVVGTDSVFGKFMILTVISPKRKEESLL